MHARSAASPGIACRSWRWRETGAGLPAVEVCPRGCKLTESSGAGRCELAGEVPELRLMTAQSERRRPGGPPRSHRQLDGPQYCWHHRCESAPGAPTPEIFSYPATPVSGMSAQSLYRVVITLSQCGVSPAFASRPAALARSLSVKSPAHLGCPISYSIVSSGRPRLTSHGMATSS